jgi:hypothetical protein
MSLFKRNSLTLPPEPSPQPMFRFVLVLACAVAVAHAQSVQSACKSITVTPTAGICKDTKVSGMACVPSNMTAEIYSASVVMSLCAARVIEIRNRWTDQLVYFCRRLPLSACLMPPLCARTCRKGALPWEEPAIPISARKVASVAKSFSLEVLRVWMMLFVTIQRRGRSPAARAWSLISRPCTTPSALASTPNSWMNRYVALAFGVALEASVEGLATTRECPSLSSLFADQLLRIENRCADLRPVHVQMASLTPMYKAAGACSDSDCFELKMASASLMPFYPIAAVISAVLSLVFIQH